MLYQGKRRKRGAAGVLFVLVVILLAVLAFSGMGHPGLLFPPFFFFVAILSVFLVFPPVPVVVSRSSRRISARGPPLR